MNNKKRQEIQAEKLILHGDLLALRLKILNQNKVPEFVIVGSINVVRLWADNVDAARKLAARGVYHLSLPRLIARRSDLEILAHSIGAIGGE